MKTYKVICEETCPECNGAKWIPNPECYKFKNPRSITELDRIGEEIPCPKCNGTGTIRTEVDMEQALIEIDRKRYGDEYIEALKSNIR